MITPAINIHRCSHIPGLLLVIVAIGTGYFAPFVQADNDNRVQRMAGPEPLSVDLAALQRLAIDGDEAAQAALGDIYANGHGVLQDFATAVKWHQLAATQGHAAAQNALGRHYAEGYGVAKNVILASDWLLTAAKQGAPQHQHDLAQLLDDGPEEVQDLPQAVVWYQRAVAQDFVLSQANLGLLYYLGRGVPQDLKQALTLLRAAAEKGHARAQNNLGLMYTRGEGVEKDYAQAVKWFERAAEQRLGQALTNLGVMYENGFGVKPDEEEARRLYRLGGHSGGNTLQAALEAVGMPYDLRLAPPDLSLETFTELQMAAASGDPVAEYTLAYVLTTADGVERDYAAAARLYALAADNGMHSAMLNLGLLHMHGLGVPQDFVNGYMWISKATAGGSAAAIDIRDRLLPYLTTGQVNEAQKLAKE